MEHSEAQATMAAERYLLGEMPIEEREAFEEHYFGCAECAADVRDEALFADSIRRENVVSFRPRAAARASWMLNAAAVAGMAILGYQNVALRSAASMAASLRQPVIPHEYAVTSDEERGAGEKAVTLQNPDVEASALVFSEMSDFPSYELTLRDGAGKQVAAPLRAASAPAVSYVIPPHVLKPGNYTLVVDGIDGQRRQPNVKSVSIVVPSR